MGRPDDALSALAELAAATGLSVTPIAAEDVRGVDLVILRTAVRMSIEHRRLLRDLWDQGVKGTALEGLRALVLEHGLDVEFVRARSLNGRSRHGQDREEETERISRPGATAERRNEDPPASA